MPVWWTKRSLPPSSGVMKPNPLSSLNHFTVPVAIAFSFVVCRVRGELKSNDLRALALTFAGPLPALAGARVAAWAERVLAARLPPLCLDALLVLYALRLARLARLLVAVGDLGLVGLPGGLAA